MTDGIGRPTKLTSDLTEQVVSAIEEGNYVETAAQAVGIHPATYYNWMTWGAQGKEPYAAFFEAVTCARARAEMQLVREVRTGDDKGVSFGPARAAAFMLERTRPDKFAQRVNLKVKDAVEEVLECVRRVCSEEDFARVLEELSRRDSGDEAEGAASEGTSELH